MATTTTILVVEDEEAFVDALTVGLKREGFRVQVARDGAEALAREALAAAPARATYARIDIVPDDDGRLMIMELELIEPALFLDHAPDGGAAFTRSILSAVQKATA